MDNFFNRNCAPKIKWKNPVFFRCTSLWVLLRPHPARNRLVTARFAAREPGFCRTESHRVHRNLPAWGIGKSRLQRARYSLFL